MQILIFLLVYDLGIEMLKVFDTSFFELKEVRLVKVENIKKVNLHNIYTKNR